MAGSLANFALTFAFFTAIAVVLVLTDWNVSAGARNELEMRPVRSFPSISPANLTSFPREFYNFFGDNFGLRGWALNARTKIWLALLRLDPAPDLAFSSRVYLGSDDWLFYAGERETDDMLHADPLTNTSLSTWSEEIARRRKWLGMRGINYLFVVTPDKRTIYTEQLPNFFRLHRPGFTRREQLMDRLRDEPSFLDLTEAIRAAKSFRLLYYRWDTHWNHHGAYEAYRVVIEFISVCLPCRRTSVARQSPKIALVISVG